MKTLTIVLSLFMLMQSQARPTAKMKFKQTRVNERGTHQVIAARAGCLSFWKLSDYDGRADGVPSYTGLDEGPAGRSWNSVSGVSYHADGPGGSVAGCVNLGSAGHLTVGHVDLGTGTRTAALFVKLTTKTTGRLLNIGGSFTLHYNAAADRFRLTVIGNTSTINIDADALGSPSADKWYWIQVAYNAATQEAGLRVVGTSSLHLRQQLGARLGESMTWLAVPGGVATPTTVFALNGYTATGCVCRLAGVGYWSRLLNDWEAAFLAAGVDWPFYWPTVTARLSPVLSGWAGGTQPDPVYLLWDDTDPAPVSYQLRVFEIDGAENIASTAAFVSGNSLGALADYLDENNNSNQAYLLVRGLNASGYPITPWSNVLPGREYEPDVAQSAGSPGLRRPIGTPDAPTGLSRAGTGPVTITFTPSAGHRHEVWAEAVAEAGYELLTTLDANVASYEHAAGTAATSYRVRAVGYGEPSDWISSAGVTIPTAPSGLAAVNDAGDWRLNWNDESSAPGQESGFEVWFGTEGAALTLLATTAADVETYNTAVGIGVQIAAKVRSVNAAGNSAYTDTIYTTPEAPVIASITAPGVLNVEFEFTHPDQSGNAYVQGYYIEARNLTQSSAWEGMGTLPPGYTAAVELDCTTMTPAGVDGDEIEVRIRAYKGALNSAWSNTMSVNISV